MTRSSCTPSSLPGQPYSTAKKLTKHRILICTPSNAAVDEVIRRLIKDGVINMEQSNILVSMPLCGITICI